MNKPNVQWLENTQLDYFNTAANILGYRNLPLAWGLSLVSWKSKDDLNSFLNAFAYGQSGSGQGAA
jgi:hypothetical protein